MGSMAQSIRYIIRNVRLTLASTGHVTVSFVRCTDTAIDAMFKTRAFHF
jgi:hypothetical protein